MRQLCQHARHMSFDMVQGLAWEYFTSLQREPRKGRGGGGGEGRLGERLKVQGRVELPAAPRGAQFAPT